MLEDLAFAESALVMYVDRVPPLVLIPLHTAAEHQALVLPASFPRAWDLVVALVRLVPLRVDPRDLVDRGGADLDGLRVPERLGPNRPELNRVPLLLHARGILVHLVKQDDPDRARGKIRGASRGGHGQNPALEDLLVDRVGAVFGPRS